jgi:hypothetical protein
MAGIPANHITGDSFKLSIRSIDDNVEQNLASRASYLQALGLHVVTY